MKGHLSMVAVEGIHHIDGQLGSAAQVASRTDSRRFAQSSGTPIELSGLMPEQVHEIEIIRDFLTRGLREQYHHRRFAQTGTHLLTEGAK